jgi:hypothetical protein
VDTYDSFLLYPGFLVILVPVMGYDLAFHSPFSKYSIRNIPLITQLQDFFVLCDGKMDGAPKSTGNL